MQQSSEASDRCHAESVSDESGDVQIQRGDVQVLDAPKDDNEDFFPQTPTTALHAVIVEEGGHTIDCAVTPTKGAMPRHCDAADLPELRSVAAIELPHAEPSEGEGVPPTMKRAHLFKDRQWVDSLRRRRTTTATSPSPLPCDAPSGMAATSSSGGGRILSASSHEKGYFLAHAEVHLPDIPCCASPPTITGVTVTPESRLQGNMMDGTAAPSMTFTSDGGRKSDTFLQPPTSWEGRSSLAGCSPTPACLPVAGETSVNPPSRAPATLVGNVVRARNLRKGSPYRNHSFSSTPPKQVQARAEPISPLQQQECISDDTNVLTQSPRFMERPSHSTESPSRGHSSTSVLNEQQAVYQMMRELVCGFVPTDDPELASGTILDLTSSSVRWPIPQDRDVGSRGMGSVPSRTFRPVQASHSPTSCSRTLSVPSRSERRERTKMLSVSRSTSLLLMSPRGYCAPLVAGGTPSTCSSTPPLHSGSGDDMVGRTGVFPREVPLKSWMGKSLDDSDSHGCLTRTFPATRSRTGAELPQCVSRHCTAEGGLLVRSCRATPSAWERLAPAPPSMVAATKENRRTSSFSSLHFSMTRRSWQMANNVPSTLTVSRSPSTEHRSGCTSQLSTTNRTGKEADRDSETVRREKGESSIPDGEWLDEGGDWMPNGVGLHETPVYVLIPRYEVLEGGETEQEAVLRRLRASAFGGRLQQPPRSTEDHPRMKAIVATTSTQLTTGTPGLTSARDSGAGSPKQLPGQERAVGTAPSRDTHLRTWSPQVEQSNEGFSFGTVSACYAMDPEEEAELEAATGSMPADCKVAARLTFDADKGVMLLNPSQEVERYSAQHSPAGGSGAAAAHGDEEDACGCDAAMITRHFRGMDYSMYHAHVLFDHCVCCQRRPAAFLCLHCFQAVCPSHVPQHYNAHPEECSLFLNELDIMTSFDRIFWCEKCQRFTWKFTEIYDALVDQIAYTRGTYLRDAVRDIHCFGFEAHLRRDVPGVTVSCSRSGSPMSPIFNDGDHRLANKGLSESSNLSVSMTAGAAGSIASPAMCSSPLSRLLRRESEQFVNGNVVTVGKALRKLTALGARVQGWRSTQEDAEAVFMVDIPMLADPSRPVGEVGGQASPAGGDPQPSATAGTETTRIPMAVYCVFDGHGGDAVAKLAATLFEGFLRKAIALVRPDDIRARALLVHVNMESSLRVSAGSPSHSCGNNLTRSQAERSLQPGSPHAAHSADPLREGERCSLIDTMSTTDLHGPGRPTGRSHEARRLSKSLLEGSPLTLSIAHEEPGFSEPQSKDCMGFCLPSALVSVPEMEMLRTYFASIMEDALLELDQHLKNTKEGQRGDYNCVGCTACIVGITSNFILCANAGDSGAALYDAKSITSISVKHRISDPTEQARIKAAGYAIENDRIEGMLAVPRALGDFDFKQSGDRGPREQAVCAVPEVTIHPVPATTDERERWGVLLACDGVWDTATLHQIHYAVTNTPNDLDVAASATEVVLRGRELEAQWCQSRLCKSGAIMPPACPLNELGYQNGCSSIPPSGVPPLLGVTGPNGDPSYGVDSLLLTSAAGIFAQCIAPDDNGECVGLDNCSIILVEPRL